MLSKEATTPGWAQRRGTSSSSSAAARGGSGGGPTVVAIAQRWQHSGAAVAVASPRQAVYQVVVVTGDVRGAGSAAPAVVTLVGSEGESEPYLIGDTGEDRGFERATRKTYAFSSRWLGELQRVHVQQLPSASDGGGVGWYLDRIEVAGPEGEHWDFPCSAWLGKSNSPSGLDGDHERNLAPAVMRSSLHSMREPSYNLLGAPLHPEVSAVALPHPEKAAKGEKGLNRQGFGYGGEDAYFSCSNRNGITALGVADGVYSWREQGIDAGQFSRRLMEFARHSVDLGTTDVLRVLQFAAKRLRLEGILGSSTACIVLIDQLQGRLAAANLGDSGFLVIGRRRGEGGRVASGAASGRRRQLAIKYRSPQQEHSFGYPYQLGHFQGADLPEDAMLTTMPISPGDLVLLGSDGLWDNVSEDELLDEVERDIVEGVKPSVIAQRLAFLAFSNSLDKDKQTPYSEGASEAFDMVYHGGKADDITIVCAVMH
ncbi:putative phosphatase 2C 55 isoform A [Micractinium conductrix]|uniref:Protein phosphatase n=1 Tax=Micractinium conductrix TaxID=554055 RepID=A0A2P6V6M1_9CHLO|nr:putative phosphatase 2C 55 isoform A [Micractinium conductrix]|eukprot:PSC69732.1 putative phosphatase 2C 55 isoform A [Micractinium conductrix]